MWQWLVGNSLGKSCDHSWHKENENQHDLSLQVGSVLCPLAWPIVKGEENGIMTPSNNEETQKRC